jgi:hypothetical protein
MHVAPVHLDSDQTVPHNPGTCMKVISYASHQQ